MGFQWPIIHGESAKRLEGDFGSDFQRFWGQGSYINVLLEAGERHHRHNIKCKGGTGDGERARGWRTRRSTHPTSDGEGRSKEL